jgi:hypothetical protein
MWRRVDSVRADVSEELVASIFRAETISELGTTLAVTSRLLSVPSLLILSTVKMEATHSCETSILTRPLQRHIQEDGILHSRRRENLKSYITELYPAFLKEETWEDIKMSVT